MPDATPSGPTLLPDHDAIAAAIVRLGLGVDAAELHGSLCGYLSGGGTGTRADWLDRLALDPGAGHPHGADIGAARPAPDPLDALYLTSVQQLADPEFGFELLLPDDDAPLARRADALVGWCRGFLGGFGLAAAATPPLSEDAAEALQDLGRIAASNLGYADSDVDADDSDEDALEEVAEFVRIAVLLLHGDCVLAPQRRQRLH